MPFRFSTQWISKFGRPRGPAQCVGLDIGTFSVKGVKLHCVGGRTEVLQVEAAEIPPGGDAQSRAGALRQVSEKLGCRESPTVAAVGGPGTVFRRVCLPKMSPKELRSALSFEAEKYIPFKLEEVFFDFFILEGGANGQMDVLLAAARKEVVNDLLKLLSACEVTPVAVDMEVVALANAWQGVAGARCKGVTGLLHLGSCGTILDIVRDSQLEFGREVPIGGTAFTKAGETRPALQPVWEEWLGQCRTSFDFYENQSGQRLERLALSSGGARLAGFKEWVQEASGLQTEVWDPLAGIAGAEQVAPAEAGPEVRAGFALAVGLALRGVKG